MGARRKGDTLRFDPYGGRQFHDGQRQAAVGDRRRRVAQHGRHVAPEEDVYKRQIPGRDFHIPASISGPDRERRLLPETTR